MLLRQDNCSLHQHDVVDSPVRAGLQHRGRFIRPSLAAWSTSTYWAAPVCMSCLLDMSKVTALVDRVFFQHNGGKLSYTINHRLHWVVQWAGAQVTDATVWLASNHQLEGTIGRVVDMAHTGSFITRHSHLNLLWIHIVLSTPMIYKLWRIISRSNMENLKTTP